MTAPGGGGGRRGRAPGRRGGEGQVRGSGILVERNVIIEEATMSEATNTCPENAKRDPQLMTAREVAQKLRLSVSFIYERIADGSLPHFRLGSGQGGIRVSEE